MYLPLRYFSFSYPLGGEFKIFVAVSSDELFISILGVVAGLLLLAIALLGHLLGFHIYLSKLHLRAELCTHQQGVIKF